jgi:hypothetical protein
LNKDSLSVGAEELLEVFLADEPTTETEEIEESAQMA